MSLHHLHPHIHLSFSCHVDPTRSLFFARPGGALEPALQGARSAPVRDRGRQAVGWLEPAAGACAGRCGRSGSLVLAGRLRRPKKAKNKVQEKGQEAVDQAKAAVSGGALNKDQFVEFTLKEIKPYNHDSATLVFELPDGKKPGMNVASAVVVKAVGDGLKDDKGKDVIRPYTPITSPDTEGHMDFLVKKYPGGLMTTHMHSMKPGDKLGIKGPSPSSPTRRTSLSRSA